MKIRYGHKLHEVFLCDDGTMDTVIEVDGVEHRFDCEYASNMRDKTGAMTERGLRELGLEVLSE